MKKVLVVSHNVFCKTSSMGKTLLSYFEQWGTDNVAQFYIHSEVPTDDSCCVNYYRVTDKEMVKSVFTRRSGSRFGKSDIQKDRVSSRTDEGLSAAIYQKARKRTPFIYFARNLIWRLGRWNTKKLRKWIDEFNPDAVFFASGDYAFMYIVARKIAKMKNIPLYVCCMDDYYINNKNESRFGGRLTHKAFMKQVKKTVSASAGMFTICEKMKEDYFKMFGVPCHTLHTAASFEGPLSCEKKTGAISYIGNVGYNRHKQLISLGRALRSIESEVPCACIDVYSSEKRPEILRDLKPENGINFHGEISSDEVKNVMAESMFLIHTESFDGESRKAVAYSVSTKIADSLASGTCLIAYGPEEIASIKYLADNQAAFCIFDDHNLSDRLKVIINDTKRYSEIVDNARALSIKNHGSKCALETIKAVICEE
ncbi:MAG: glycosyltransferase [Clostridia bacterium]|nr:glycosyltransferase [Clostridia bacterium]